MFAGHGFPIRSTGKNIACVSCTLYNTFSLEAHPSAPQGGLMSSKQVSAATRASASQFVLRCVLALSTSTFLATWTLTTHHPLRWTSFAIVSFASCYVFVLHASENAHIVQCVEELGCKEACPRTGFSELRTEAAPGPITEAAFASSWFASGVQLGGSKLGP